jgi:hypothetical protein
MFAAIWLGELHKKTPDVHIGGDNISRHLNEIDFDMVNLTGNIIQWYFFRFWC